MRTNKEFVSRVLNDFKSVNKDADLKRRHVLNIGREKASFLVSQKWDELSLTREEGMITHIDCLEFKSINVKSCGIFEFKTCTNLMRSVDKIPQLIFGKNGPAILHATTVDGLNSYDYINPRDFQSIAKRKYIIKDSRYFYIKDGHVYLPNSTTELLDVSIITLDKKGSMKCSTCNDSDPMTNNSGQVLDSCSPVWDFDFVCPDRLYDVVVRDTLQELGSMWAGSAEDENPNLNINEKQ
jgi:hypothetical protein